MEVLFGLGLEILTDRSEANDILDVSPTSPSSPDLPLLVGGEELILSFIRW